jgi:mono/diheme cytochrome c family protein
LTQLSANATGEIKTLAASVASKLNWAGKPQPVITVTPLTPEEQKRYEAGRQVYSTLCVACHQPDGRGREKVAPSLVESRYATGDAGAPTRVVLGGKEGQVGLMPPLKDALNDDQIASVLTYIRREWGNTGSAVDPDDVREIRQITRPRTRPWTDEELLPAGRGGGGGGRGGQ